MLQHGINWDFVYEEEHYDIYGYCSTGVISNGKQFLFYIIGCDDPRTVEICRVYSSISFAAESLLCQYEWTAANDDILLNCLNNLREQDTIVGENSPIKNLQFSLINNNTV